MIIVSNTFWEYVRNAPCDANLAAIVKRVAGCEVDLPDHMAAIALAFKSDAECISRSIQDRRERARERQAAHRNSSLCHAMSRDVTVTDECHTRSCDSDDVTPYITNQLTNQLIKEEEKEKVQKKPTKKTPETDDGFMAFWNAYGKKLDRPAAYRAWLKAQAKKSWPGTEAVIEIVGKWNSTTDWQKDGGQFKPYPASWLNAEGWMNEFPESAPTVDESLIDIVSTFREFEHE